MWNRQGQPCLRILPMSHLNRRQIGERLGERLGEQQLTTGLNFTDSSTFEGGYGLVKQESDNSDHEQRHDH